MNKIQQYDAKYRAVREEALRVPACDISLLEAVASEAAIPLNAYLHVDENDRELRERIARESVTRLLGYFATHPAMRGPVFDWLSPRDEHTEPGVLLVYGAGGNARPREAASLYGAHHQPVIVSDADPIVRQKFTGVMTERGVSKSDIHNEDRARNYLENACYSLALCKEKFSDVKTVTVVTESLVARRALVATQMYAPDGVNIMSSPMLTDPDDPSHDPTSPEAWYSSQLGMNLLLSEMAGFALYKRFGLIT